mmetsp:Transcript_33998/g.133292  ORF Transcript_33998/g.133292 Transcript_33998/m.133292 type:complete len:250 (-) Transcript_33998:917-1666(-)|eukprot:CAMPEP_0113961598 /NCGR_PEP_ID=MMETSP0011_2-20120614/5404_1 /TAXON_ID=101924 /ORGANISM="Rhodosorus marinus" /LENGTH=249 /DNA_ID=CAMNT_0000973269 /DNA_START=84 /DNA_END=833 /DNA_ORIENTATION=+ /assembly_acc=CAM_ASM_000156
MADEEIDEELLALEAELKGLEKNSGVIESAPKPVEQIVVAAKPAVPLRTALQPEWQQELYERDYQRMQMMKESRDGDEQKGVNGEGADGNAGRAAEASTPVHQPPAHAVEPHDFQGPMMPPTRKKILRTAAGEVWEDPTLEAWPENDHRIFVGDLAGDATDEVLTAAFQKFDSFQMARVVKDKRTRKCRGFGFVSFASAEDMVKAMKEMNGKYVGNRPVKLRKSNWNERTLTRDKRKEVRIFKKLISKK